VTLDELLTGFLRALEVALRTRSNLPRAILKEKRFEAVVASPANAFCTQRFVTLEAFRAAGFTVRAMLNEPSAAGFEYAHRHARTLTSKREHVLVYDLGGGTFDASLVLMTGVQHDVVATCGLAELGGDDFDEVLVGLVAAEAKLSLSSLTPWFRRRLTEACREAKEALTPNSRKLTVDLESALGEGAPTPTVTLSAEAYAEACEPLVQRTLEAMAPLLEQLPGDDELTGVAGVYVVGGASNLPVVARTLRDTFGRRVHRSPYPFGAVAIGLAIAADRDGPFILRDRFSRNFGVFREAQGGRAATYDTILSRDTALPKAGAPPLQVERTYRAAHNVGHYRFFECAAFDAQGNPQGDIAPLTDVYFAFDPALRSRGRLDEVPVQRLEREGPRVAERYSVDARGLVQVLISDLDSGYTATHVLGSAKAAPRAR
jgi:molecular chaperone DnaK (HSP70)